MIDDNKERKESFCIVWQVLARFLFQFVSMTNLRLTFLCWAFFVRSSSSAKLRLRISSSRISSSRISSYPQFFVSHFSVSAFLRLRNSLYRKSSSTHFFVRESSSANLCPQIFVRNSSSANLCPQFFVRKSLITDLRLCNSSSANLRPQIFVRKYLSAHIEKERDEYGSLK